MNSIVLTGRLTAAPERKQAGNSSVTKFSIAVGRDHPGKDGTYATDFYDCQCWGNAGERLAQWMTTGSGIIVIGSMLTDSWTDKEGNTHKKPYVNVDKFIHIEYVKHGKTQSAAQEAPSWEHTDMKVSPLSESEENDLPF